MGIDLPAGAEHRMERFTDVFKKHGVDGPTAHCGALINRKVVTPDIISHYRQRLQVNGKPLVGIDLFAGPNVDVVADLCAPEFHDNNPKLANAFGLVVCSALLEHVKNPFDAAKNIERLIRPGGHLYFGGPWVMGYHPYPGDYWRISFSGIKVLFPNVEFDDWWYSASIKDSVIRLKDAKLERRLFLQETTVGAGSLIADRSLPYLNIHAIGRRKKLASSHVRSPGPAASLSDIKSSVSRGSNWFARKVKAVVGLKPPAR